MVHNNQRQLEADFIITVKEFYYYMFTAELYSMLSTLVHIDYVLGRFPHPNLKIIILVGTDYQSVIDDI